MAKTVNCRACGQWRRHFNGAVCLVAPGHILRTGASLENGKEVTFVLFNMPEIECPKYSTPALTTPFKELHKLVYKNLPMINGVRSAEELSLIAHAYDGAVIFDDRGHTQEIWLPLTDEEKKSRAHRLRVANYTGNYYHG